jgi:hypothetical protein
MVTFSLRFCLTAGPNQKFRNLKAKARMTVEARSAKNWFLTKGPNEIQSISSFQRLIGLADKSGFKHPKSDIKFKSRKCQRKSKEGILEKCHDGSISVRDVGRIEDIAISQCSYHASRSFACIHCVGCTFRLQTSSITRATQINLFTSAVLLKRHLRLFIFCRKYDFMH